MAIGTMTVGAIAPRTALDVRLTCGNFQARSAVAGGSIDVAGGDKWSEECPSRDIFYTLAEHCSRCSSFRIPTFRKCRTLIGEILIRSTFTFVPTRNGRSALFT